MNLDTRVDPADVLVLHRFLLGEISLSDEAFDAADVAPVVNDEIDPDDFVNRGDLIVLLRAIADPTLLPDPPEAPTLDPIDPPPNSNPIQVTGIIDPDATIRVYVNGEEQDALCTNNAGSLTCTRVVLFDGSNTIRVVAVNGVATSNAAALVTSYTDESFRGDFSVPQNPDPVENTVVWTPGEPLDDYEISSNFTIPGGATLIILRGTRIRFEAEAGINFLVDGTLDVRGADQGSNCTTFTSNASSPDRGDWGGIDIGTGSAGSTIEFACIEYADRGIELLSDGQPGLSGGVVVRSSRITEFDTVGVHNRRRNSAVLLTTIDNSSGPRDGECIFLDGEFNDSASGSIKDNVILGCDVGVHLHHANPVMRRNTIQNHDDGIVISGWRGGASIVDRNVITGNVRGISTSPSIVDGSLFADPTITGNEIHSNTLNFRSAPETEGFFLNAERNWWGTPVPAEIALSIEDAADPPAGNDPPRAWVDFAPFRGSADPNNVDFSYHMGIADENATNLEEDGDVTEFTILGRLHVPDGSTWTVPAGVTLNMLGDLGEPPVFGSYGRSVIEVAGSLDINGTVLDPAVFQSGQVAPIPGDWEGIQISGSGASTIDGAVILDASRAVDVEGSGGATLQIRDSEIREFEISGISMTDVTGGLIDGNVIDNDRIPPGAGPGIGIDLIRSTPTVTANTIMHTDTGLHVLGPDHPAQIGGDPATQGNVITENAVGIWLQGTGAAGGDPDPIIKGNDIYDNGKTFSKGLQRANLRISDFEPDSTTELDAQENYWGSTDPTTVRGMILEDLANPIEIDASGLLDDNRNPTAITLRLNALLSEISVTPDRFSPTLLASAAIQFMAPTGTSVTLRIYREDEDDFTGAPVFSDQMPATGGSDSLSWDGKDSQNPAQFVEEGAYIYVLEAQNAGVTDLYHPALDVDRVGEGCCNSEGLDFNTFRNEFWTYDYRLVKDAAPTPPVPIVDSDYPSRVTLTVREPGSGATLATPFTGRIFFPGFTLVVWDGRDDNGNVLSGDLEFSFIGPKALKPSYVVVEGTHPAISAPGGASPGLDIKADPYIIRQSYDQTTTITFEVSEDADVQVEIFDSVSELALATIQVPDVTAETLTAVEWPTGTGQPPSSLEGPFTFVIEAESDANPALTHTHRGVIQVRK